MTIRRRLERAFLLILALFAANLCVYFWSSDRREASVDQLQRAVTRRLNLQSIHQGILDIRRQVSVLNGITPEAGMSGVDAQAQAELEAKLNIINASAHELTRLAPADERVAFEALEQTSQKLTDRWRTFFRSVGKRQVQAIQALSGEDGADSLADRLLSKSLPDRMVAEVKRVPEARAHMDMVVQINNTITLLLFGASLIVAGMVAYVVSSHLSQGLKALEDGAEAIGAGDFTHEMNASAQDEIGRVAVAFNTMRERLDAANEGLRAAEKNALAASQAKSEFLAKMSHELRTPLNAIIGYSEMLQEEAEDIDQPSMVADLGKIRAAGRHLLALINDILDLSKIEAGKMEVFLEEFEIGPMVQDVVATVQPLVSRNENRLTVEVDPEIGAMHSDLTKVRQTLFNLLSNACKFTSGGEVTLKVAPTVHEGRPAVAFTVSDTGIGMTPEQLSRLFQEFSQAEASTSRHFGGSGLGLAITKRFSEMLGGAVSVRSEVGVGSTFTLTLPRRSEDAASSPEPVVADEPGPIGATVLVIDDDPDMRALIGKLLEQDGFQVIAAANGEDGLRLARDRRPDLITLDVMMPVMDGWTVLSSLKADPETAQIPVILLTMVADRDAGLALGAADYLVKPIDRSQLTTVLRKFWRETEIHPVLVVDDDPGTRSLLRRILEKAGWSVYEADNGRAALETVLATPPDLILLDLMMPEMDGFELLAELEKRPECRELPVVVVTAKTLGPEERSRLHGGVERILVKGSFTRGELLSEVRRRIAERLKPAV